MLSLALLAAVEPALGQHLGLDLNGGWQTINRSASLVEYQNYKFGFLLTCDVTQVTTTNWGSGLGMDFHRGQDFVGQLRMILPFHFKARDDGATLSKLRDTGLLQDSALSSAFMHMTIYCMAGGPDAEAGLEIPPTKLLRLVNKHGVRYLKFWSNYETVWLRKPAERVPVGPFYLVDFSTSDRQLFVYLKYDCAKATPTWAESLLDSLVSSMDRFKK